MKIIPDYKGCIIQDNAKRLIAVEIGPGGAKVVEAKPALRNTKKVLAGIDPDEHVPGTALFRECDDGTIDYIGHLVFAADNLPETAYQCDNCELLFTDTDELREIEDFMQRVAPGETVPFGECPACGCLVHEFEYEPAAMVVVKGGCVQEIVTSVPMRVMVKDLDVDGVYAEDLTADPEGIPCMYDMFVSKASPKTMRKNHAAAFPNPEG